MGLCVAEPLFLLDAEHRARLDQIEAKRAAKLRRDGGGAQKVAHFHTATGAQLCQDDRVAPSCPLPQLGAPQPDQLAEDLADLRGGREVAFRADRVAPRIVAACRVMQRHCHVGRNRERALSANPPGDLPGYSLGHDRTGTRARSAQAMIRIPAISSGIDKS